MAWSRLQSAPAGSTAGTSVTSTFTTANLSAGSKIIAYASIGATSAPAITSVTATGGNTLTQVAVASQANARIYIYACDASGAGGTSMVGTKPTITANWSGAGGGLGLVVQEISGLLAGNTTAMCDGTAGTLTGTASSTGDPTYADTAAGQFKAAAYGDFGTGFTVATNGSWTADANNVNASTNSNCLVQFKSSTGAQESDGFTSADSGGWAVAEIAFKLAATASTPPQPPAAPPGRQSPMAFPYVIQPAQPAPAAAAPAVPAPVVAAAPPPPGWGQPNAGFTSRNSLADAPVLTTPAPKVIPPAVTQGFGQPQAAVITASPAPPAAAPAQASAPPLVVTPAPSPPPAAVTVVTRGAVQDPADFKGRQPVITVPQPPPPAPVPPVTVRNTLADPPVLTTPAPQVIPAAATPGHGRPGPAIITSAPLIPVAVPTQATPAPLVAWAQPPVVPPQQALTSRNSLADAPVLTTPAPVVVMATAVTPHGRPQAAVIASNPAPAAAAPAAVTPQPVVVAQAVKIAAAQPPVILRNTLADPPVLTTPRPVVVMTQVRPPRTTTVISGAPFISPPPLFTVGALTASAAPAAVLTAAGTASALTAATAAGALTASTARSGVLTASDTPGPGAAGLLDEAALAVLDEGGAFILNEDGT